MDDPIQVELMLCRFRRLMAEVHSGVARRNNFEPWEIEILLDLQSCHFSRRRWPHLLQRYQKAVQRQLENGVGPPPTLSQYLAQCEEKRTGDRTGYGQAADVTEQPG